jgi:hypothetical protein
MRPAKNLLDKVLIDQLFAEKKREELKREKPTEQGIVEKSDFFIFLILFLFIFLVKNQKFILIPALNVNPEKSTVASLTFLI